MGDYTHEQVYSAEKAVLSIPDPRLFHDRVKNIRKNTEINIVGFTMYPFLCLLVKSEMFPLGTAVEAVSTLVLLIVWIHIAIMASGGWLVATVGAVSFLIGSNMLHFWYGTFRDGELKGTRWVVIK